MAIDNLEEEIVPENERRKSSSEIIADSDVNASGGFDCNICLESVQDPVVTLCGHLYCWPCIYKWLRVQNSSLDHEEQENPLCPVCKAEVSQSSLVPLYGRGLTTGPSKGKTHQVGIVIPERPRGPRSLNTSTVSQPISQSYDDQYGISQSYVDHYSAPYYGRPISHDDAYSTLYSTRPISLSYDDPYSTPYSTQPISQSYHDLYSIPYYPPLQLNSYTRASTSPMLRLDNILGMYRDILEATVYGNQMLNMHRFDSEAYTLLGSSDPRVRRQIWLIERSFSRISLFLLCCLVFCLIAF